MVSQDLSSTVVDRWVPLHIDGVVSGLHYSGNWRSRRYCSVTNKHTWDMSTLRLTIFPWKSVLSVTLMIPLHDYIILQV